MNTGYTVGMHRKGIEQGTDFGNMIEQLYQSLTELTIVNIPFQHLYVPNLLMNTGYTVGMYVLYRDRTVDRFRC
jgi:hypothetical protein